MVKFADIFTTFITDLLNYNQAEQFRKPNKDHTIEVEKQLGSWAQEKGTLIRLDFVILWNIWFQNMIQKLIHQSIFAVI